MKWQTWFLIIVFVVGGIGTIVLIGGNNDITNQQDTVSCLLSKNVTMYGTWWCPHCQDQKDRFGSAWSGFALTNYVECAEQNMTQKQVCVDAKITGYPTWRFADGSELFGAYPLEELRQKAGC